MAMWTLKTSITEIDTISWLIKANPGIKGLHRPEIKPWTSQFSTSCHSNELLRPLVLVQEQKINFTLIRYLIFLGEIKFLPDFQTKSWTLQPKLQILWFYLQQPLWMLKLKSNALFLRLKEKGWVSLLLTQNYLLNKTLNDFKLIAIKITFKIKSSNK